eukprot:c19543_g1_i1.p1 GENE.c19543_g1_i1~~c19543_g1_i1.p1  ORF type:complete len:294 (+),score=87.93 c19543_g1_i1:24-905(+)
MMEEEFHDRAEVETQLLSIISEYSFLDLFVYRTQLDGLSFHYDNEKSIGLTRTPYLKEAPVQGTRLNIEFHENQNPNKSNTEKRHPLEHTNQSLISQRKETILEVFGSRPHIELPWNFTKFIFSGFLYKQPLTLNGSISKQWKKRFSIIQENWLLYFEDKVALNDIAASHPKGILHLHDVIIEEKMDFQDSHPYCFQITFLNQSSMVFSVPTKNDLNIWIKALKHSSKISTKSVLLSENKLKKIIEKTKNTLEITTKMNQNFKSILAEEQILKEENLRLRRTVEALKLAHQKS